MNYTSTAEAHANHGLPTRAIVKRDERQMKHIYHVARRRTKNKKYSCWISLWIQYYQGSAGKLVMQLLGNKKASKKISQKYKKKIYSINWIKKHKTMFLQHNLQLIRPSGRSFVQHFNAFFVAGRFCGCHKPDYDHHLHAENKFGASI